MAADPHNVVRLILPPPVPGRPGEQYGHAARLLRDWERERILAADPDPALYVYEQSAPDEPAGGWLQRGLIGAVRLAPPEAGIVLPHEDVYPGPVAGRLALMEATQANLEPIFLLYDGIAEIARPAADAATGRHGGTSQHGATGQHGATARIVGQAAAREPLVQAVTSDGVRHRLWAITDPAALSEIAADLAPRQALIADGHHRYAAYLGLQARRRAEGAGPGPWDYGLALLVDSATYPPQIGAIHRVVPGLDVHHAAKLAGSAFAVTPLPGGAADVDGALAALAAASGAGAAFVIAGEQHGYLLTDPDPGQALASMPAGTSPQWRALPAAILQELLLTRVWGLTDDQEAVRLVHNDAAATIRSALAAAGTAVLCSPLSPADVHSVAVRGEKVPHKSTSFAPKPRTGLVLRSFAVS